jgi:hypothetical protein
MKTGVGALGNGTWQRKSRQVRELKAQFAWLPLQAQFCLVTYQDCSDALVNCAFEFSIFIPQVVFAAHT